MKYFPIFIDILGYEARANESDKPPEDIRESEAEVGL